MFFRRWQLRNWKIVDWVIKLALKLNITKEKICKYNKSYLKWKFVIEKVQGAIFIQKAKIFLNDFIASYRILKKLWKL